MTSVGMRFQKREFPGVRARATSIRILATVLRSSSRTSSMRPCISTSTWGSNRRPSIMGSRLSRSGPHWEIPREVDRCLHTDFKPNLPVLRLPLQPCASFFSVRQPATCGGNSSIEGVQQNQPMANDRSSPDRQEGLQAVRNTLRQCCLVQRVLSFGDQVWASLPISTRSPGTRKGITAACR